MPRQLSRVFLKALTTPGRFVERVRVEAARSHLENTHAPLEVIADTGVIGGVETMRRALKV